MSLPIPSITLPLPSITPGPSSDPGDSSTPGPEPSDPPSSSGGGSSVNPSSGGGSSGGGSSGGPSSSGGGSSSAEPSSSEESSTETTLSETSTSVFESLSVITSDGRTLTTSVLVTTIVEPGTVITAPAHTGGASANVGAIVGGVIGGLVGLVALVGLIFFLLKRRRKNFDKEFDGNFDPDYVSKHNTGGPLAFTTAGGAALATATGAHRKSHSLEKAGRQRVNLNNADRASLEAAALAEDDGMGGRLDASTVGGGIVTPFPFPQGQGGPQGGGYSGHQTPYNPAMSPPPMSMNSLPPASPPSGPNMGLAGMGAAGAAGYYAGHHQQQGHHGQQGYGYGQQPYGGQGYPDRHGAISPSTTDHSYPNSANPYLAGAPSSNGHGGAYGGYVDPSNQSVYGGVAPSVTGTSASGYGPPPHAGTFGGAGAAMSSAASTHSSAGTGGPAGALSYTTGSGAMSAKEREARGMRPTGGLGVVNPDERPENRRAEGSAGSVLPSPFDAALGGGGGKAAEANANARNGQGGLIVHQDGGRVRQEEDESAPGEIPPAYDSVLYGK